MMNKQEKVILQNCVDRINQLASLERASFSIDKEKDENVKKIIKPYMMWFEITAMYIQELIELQDKESGYFKQEELNRMERESYHL